MSSQRTILFCIPTFLCENEKFSANIDYFLPTPWFCERWLNISFHFSKDHPIFVQTYLKRALCHKPECVNAVLGSLSCSRWEAALYLVHMTSASAAA